MVFGHFLLSSHNFMVTPLGSCVKWPLLIFSELVGLGVRVPCASCLDGCMLDVDNEAPLQELRGLEYMGLASLRV